MADVTRILNQIEQGDHCASDKLLPLVYEELRVLARQRLANEKPGQTLQATALVHEAYLRLMGNEQDQNWNNRGHFFAAAAEAMRRILVESARRKSRLKRGGQAKREEVFDFECLDTPIGDEVLDLDQALQHLAIDEPRSAKLAVMRYFAGLTLEEAADALGISTRTAKRDWAYARACLGRSLRHTTHRKADSLKFSFSMSPFPCGWRIGFRNATRRNATRIACHAPKSGSQ